MLLWANQHPRPTALPYSLSQSAASQLQQLHGRSGIRSCRRPCCGHRYPACLLCVSSSTITAVREQRRLKATMAKRAHALSWPALVLVHTASVYAVIQDRSLHIDNDPAPPPDQGPPLSRNASRDMSLLPGQVCGIVGAYFFTIAVIQVCLFTFGRRMRRAAQQTQSGDEVEMKKPLGKRVQTSPTSPASSQRTWPIWGSPNKIRNSFRKSNAASPATVTSFDQSVLESDKVQRQMEMERLYAAVMQQEDGRTSKVVVTEVQEEIELEPAASRRQALRLDTGAPGLLATSTLQYPSDPASPSSPTSPRSPVRAIYPPGSSMQRGSNAATSPSRAPYNQDPHPLRNSFGHDCDRTLSTTSAGSKSHGRLLDLRIPAAKSRYPTSEHGEDEIRTPLTPRDGSHADHTPSPLADSMATTPTISYQAYRGGDVGEPVPGSRPIPDRNFPRIPNRTPPAMSRAPVTNLHPSSSTLPLRAMAPTSPSWSNIQTTTLEPRRDLLSISALRTGLATPYSPYMPFTPITPVAARLVGREERRIREREEGRRVVLDDAEGDWGRAKGDEELWGGGY